jgi:hypothetical protein
VPLGKIFLRFESTSIELALALYLVTDFQVANDRCSTRNVKNTSQNGQNTVALSVFRLSQNNIMSILDGLANLQLPNVYYT